MRLKPMLAKSVEPGDLAPYITDENYWMSQKLDGERLMICVNGSDVETIGRNGDPKLREVPPAILESFATMGLRAAGCFDGELMADGTLWLFDMPCSKFHDTQLPYRERYDALQRFLEIWQPGPKIRLLAHVRNTDAKLELVRNLFESDAEGVMIRDINAAYKAGKRSPRMLKAKFTNTVDAVVRELGVEGRDNCSLEVFDVHGNAVNVGRCSLAGKPTVCVNDVIEVKYLYAVDREAPRLVQPRMLRVRVDKAPGECTLDQLSFTDKQTIH